MKQYSLKKTILLTLLAIIIICVPVTYFILKNLDALHAKEGEQYRISLAEIKMCIRDRRITDHLGLEITFQLRIID